VKNIKWNTDKVVVSVTNGSTYEADKVIVTVSLGVLKEKLVRIRSVFWLDFELIIPISASTLSSSQLYPQKCN
jgi:protoporphyrinogen oxidase